MLGIHAFPIDSYQHVICISSSGAMKPLIFVDRKDIQEGDKLTATCMAPGERGSFIFYFYVGNEEVHSEKSDSNEFRVELPSLKSGPNNLTCKYSIGLYSSHVSSTISEPVTVRVRGKNPKVTKNDLTLFSVIFDHAH